MKRIFVTRKLVGDAQLLLKKKGFHVNIYNEDHPIPKQELIKRVKDVDALINHVTDKIDKEVIDSMKKCKVIANCAVGYNNIDVEYANSKGIVVTNTPNVLTDSTADIAVSLVLACARRLHEGEEMMRTGKFSGYKPHLLLGIELKGKKVGIIGAGEIGFATAKRLKAFGTEIIYFNRSRKEKFESELSAKRVTLNYLLKSSDIISVHLPSTKETFHILNKTNLKLIKKRAVLVNTSRGEIVDEKFLIEMLKKKKIFAAGFDVYEGEPNVDPELLKLENVFLLPHIGSATIEARTAIAELCVKNVIAVLSGKKAITPVKAN
ncbi:MAG: 2-hydroxyacid dehydrogenase [Melioribacteraceae bacterium]